MMFLTELRANPNWTQTAANPAGFAPAIDYAETPEAFVVQLDLPGVDPETLDLTLTNNELTVKGGRAKPTIEQGAWHLRERSFGEFERTFTFATNVAGVEAETKFGVLTIKVAKAPEAIARKIPITVVR